MTTTTVQKCKECLDQMRRCAIIVNDEGYKEAESGLKQLQLELSRSFEREKALEKMLQEALKLGDAAFFRAMIPVINEADSKGYAAWAEVFKEQT